MLKRVTTLAMMRTRGEKTCPFPCPYVGVCCCCYCCYRCISPCRTWTCPDSFPGYCYCCCYVCCSPGLQTNPSCRCRWPLSLVDVCGPEKGAYRHRCTLQEHSTWDEWRSDRWWMRILWIMPFIVTLVQYKQVLSHFNWSSRSWMIDSQTLNVMMVN